MRDISLTHIKPDIPTDDQVSTCGSLQTDLRLALPRGLPVTIFSFVTPGPLLLKGWSVKVSASGSIGLVRYKDIRLRTQLVCISDQQLFQGPDIHPEYIHPEDVFWPGTVTQPWNWHSPQLQTPSIKPQKKKMSCIIKSWCNLTWAILEIISQPCFFT